VGWTAGGVFLVAAACVSMVAGVRAGSGAGLPWAAGAVMLVSGLCFTLVSDAVDTARGLPGAEAAVSSTGDLSGVEQLTAERPAVLAANEVKRRIEWGNRMYMWPAQ
jgi:hypothetical protein